LALELRADLLIVDDLAARRTAEKAGLRITGVIGVLLDGKRRGLINSVRDAMNEMRKNDFRISEETYKDALAMAGEERDTSKDEPPGPQFSPE
jgi:predicted nucleic acid-binding protein